MDGLIHAALEAEVILNRAKHVKTNLAQFGSGVSDHKMTWTNDKMHLAESSDDSRIRFQRNSVGSSSKPEKFDLFKKLHELFLELSGDEATQSNFQGLKTTSYLLEKLLAIHNLNTLIINLYPGNKGYSLSLKVNGNMQHLNPPYGNAIQEETLIETPTWPYEEEELLSYIDNEELPVILLDLLESEHSILFYSGCVIAQVRDYRQAYPSFVCDTHHVLLKPTNQSILTDAMCLSSKYGWNGEDRGALEAVEAALVHAAAPPLCLDPRPAVGLLAARLHSTSRIFNTPRIRRQAKKFSQVAVNRKRKLDQFTHHHGLELLDIIHRQRAKNSKLSTPLRSSKYPKKPPEVFKVMELPKADTVLLAPPTDHMVPLRLGRIYERNRPTPDCQPQIVEEYILETDKSPSSHGNGCFHIRLSILQRPSDQEFLGELYVDRDHVEGERNGASCRFTLGTRQHASKYITQFTEIFTEEGRKAVRIRHTMPGQVPRVSFTGDIREVNQQLLLQRNAAAVAANNTVNVQRTANTPVASATIAAAPTTIPTRQLPILQAQLQQVGSVSTGNVVTNIGNVVTNVANVGNVVTNVGNVVANVGNVSNITNVGNIPNVANVGNVGAVVGNVGAVVGNVGTVVGNVVGNVGTVVGNVITPETLKQQPSPTTPRLSPQATTNQLLAQQLTNPQQPLNTQKMQGTIIHIQPHSLMSSAGTSQVQNIQYTTSTIASQQKTTAAKPRTTNPAISALVTSLMNSAQQFQQAAANQNAAKAVASSGNSNPTILNLLNSAPAAMTNTPHGTNSETRDVHKLMPRVSIAGARLVPSTTASHTIPTYTQQSVANVQVMSGYRDSEQTNVSSSESALLERLMGGDGNTAPAAQTQPQQVCHLQGLSLTSLQGLQSIQGLQNVQVQIPGLAAPISLSLNVSGAPSGLLVSVPPTTSVVLGNQSSVLSLPIAQLMSGGVRGTVRPNVQVVRARAAPRPAPRAPPRLPGPAAPVPPHPAPAASPAAAGTAQFITQAQAQALTAQAHQVRRKSNPDSS